MATFGVTHDAAGNLSKQVVNGDGDSYQYSYDCDNRLLSVKFDEVGVGTTPLATFAYDALGRKITAWTQYDSTGADNATSNLRFYHDGQVEIADYNASDGSLARRFINGTQYIDERAVLIEGLAASADTFYYLLQELYTVTGLVEKSGALAEADVYDGYGKVRIWDYSRGDFDRDGDVDATDQTTFSVALLASGGPGKSTTDPSTDLDYDGDTDLTDSGIFATIKNSGGAVVDAFVSSVGNPFFFTGRRLYMLETLPEANNTPVANQQLQHNRARHYSPLEGRWLQRDPLFYESGLSLYESLMSEPTGWVDWNGMQIGGTTDDEDIKKIRSRYASTPNWCPPEGTGDFECPFKSVEILKIALKNRCEEEVYRRVELLNVICRLLDSAFLFNRPCCCPFTYQHNYGDIAFPIGKEKKGAKVFVSAARYPWNDKPDPTGNPITGLIRVAKGWTVTYSQARIQEYEAEIYFSIRPTHDQEKQGCHEDIRCNKTGYVEIGRSSGKDITTEGWFYRRTREDETFSDLPGP